MITKNIIEKRDNNIVLLEIANEQLRIVLSNLGGHVVSIFTKDAAGKEGDVLIGVKDIADCTTDTAYMGATIGRCANRIKNAEFELNGVNYKLGKNNGPHNLHGGPEGFDTKTFDWSWLDNGVRFNYLSPDGEMGFPGNVNVTVDMTIAEGTLTIAYDAVPDADTLISMTNHMYFNLSAGREDTIKQHTLMLSSDQYCPLDETGLVTGEVVDLANTPFDFRTAKALGECMDCDDPQMKIAGGGYDHAYKFNETRPLCVLTDPISGRRMTIDTDLPFTHLYSANTYASQVIGKEGKKYTPCAGVAIETELMPDAVHNHVGPSMIFKSGEHFISKTTYTFDII